jgi:hypothetical protein
VLLKKGQGVGTFRRPDEGVGGTSHKKRVKSTARKGSFLLQMFLHKRTHDGYTVKKQRGSYENKWHCREE